MIERSSDELSARESEALLKSTVIPRPVSLVTTQSRDGVVNCAPFSFFQVVCGHPPMISLSLARKVDSLKDTVRNLLLQSEFVTHIPRQEHLEEVELSAREFPPDVSEVDEIGFTLTESQDVSVPGLEEPPVRLECLLRDQFPIAAGAVTASSTSSPSFTSTGAP
jgi:flavin reductase (DIM6/NTAB) family NADH-FMN oxidoreductase RutF